MKKLILLGTLLVVANTAMAKEILPEVAPISEEAQTIEILEPVAEESLVLEVEKKENEDLIKGESIYNIYGRIGADIASKYDAVKIERYSLNKKETDTLGYEIGIESTVEVAEDFEVGLGVLYQNHGKSKKKIYKDGVNMLETKIASYDSLPLYVATKYNFPIVGENIKPYLKANLGYSFNFINGDSVLDNGIKLDTKVNNGLYYGVGMGLEYKNFFIDMMYQMNEAKVKIKNSGTEIKKDYDYSRVTLGFGYKFNF